MVKPCSCPPLRYDKYTGIVVRLPLVLLGLLLAAVLVLPGTASAATLAPVTALVATWSADAWTLRTWSSTTPGTTTSLGAIAPADASLRGTAAGDTGVVTLHGVRDEAGLLRIVHLPTGAITTIAGITGRVVSLDASGTRLLVQTARDGQDAMTWYRRDPASATRWDIEGQAALAADALVLPIGFRGATPLWATADAGIVRLHTPAGSEDLGTGVPSDVVLAADRSRAVLAIADGSGFRWTEIDLGVPGWQLLGQTPRFGRLVPGASGYTGGTQPGGTLPAGIRTVTAPAGQWDVPLAVSPAADLVVSQRSRGTGGRDVRDQVLVVTDPAGPLVTSWGQASWLGWISPSPGPLAADSLLALQADTPQSCWQPSGQALQPNVADVWSALDMASVNQGPEGYPVIRSIESTTSGPPMIAPRIPTQVLGAIAWIESNWRQATGTARGSVGAPLISWDCGFGMMQITSGMQASGGYPPDIKERIATDYLYNILQGADVLVEKWNYADAGPFKYVGNRDQCIVENWYYAVMAYNGASSKNFPQNPNYDPNRAIYTGGPYTGYPYQELVWGVLRNPPSISGQRLWDPIPVTYPSLDLFPDPGSLPNLPRLFPEHVSDACGGGPAPQPSPTPIPPTPTPTPIPLQANPATASMIAGHQVIRRFPVQITSPGPWVATYPYPPPGWITIEPETGPAGTSLAQIVVNAPIWVPHNWDAKTAIILSSGSLSPIVVPVDIRVVSTAYDRAFPFATRRSPGGW